MEAKTTLPVQSIINKACQIPKKVVYNMQSNEVMNAVRPIHMFNSFTQIIMRGIERKTQRPLPHYTQFGAIPGRRREEAIAIQNINRHKCIQNNVSYAQQCFYVCNAFYSINRDKLSGWIEGTNNGKKELPRVATQQVIENATAIIEATDGNIMFSPGAGVPPGLCSATNMLNCVYQQALNQYYEDCKKHHQHGSS